MLRKLHHDVVCIDRHIFGVTDQALKTRWARGQDLHLSVRARFIAKCICALAHLFFFAETHLSGDIWPSNRQSARLTAAPIIFINLAIKVAVDQCVHHFQRLVLLHGAVAGVVIHVAHTCDRIQPNSFFHQVFVNVHNPAARKDLFKLIGGELVVAGATGDHHRFDVQIVQRVGHTVKEHPVVRDNFLGLIKLAGTALGIAAAEITRW